MVYSKTALAALGLFVVLLATPQGSHGLLLNGLDILDVNVLGTLYCSATGNQELACGSSCPVVSGALVTISCDGGTTTLKQAVTSPAGAFQITFNLVEAILFNPSICSVYVKVPAVAQCAVLPPTGLFTGALELLAVVEGALGGVATFTFDHLHLVGAL